MKPTYYSGVVTLLDVLGWKGIWQRNNTAIADLESLVEQIKNNAVKWERGIGSGIQSQNILPTRVMIVSDTVVLITGTDPETIQSIISLHGKLCATAIPESIKKGIPIRGATCHGEIVFSESANIFAGKAVDEAASWHETADWIGVFMSPSASFQFHGNVPEFWVKNSPPLKNNIKLDTFAVDWAKDYDQQEIEAVKKEFCQMSPILPELVNKFANTISFISK